MRSDSSASRRSWKTAHPRGVNLPAAIPEEALVERILSRRRRATLAGGRTTLHGDLAARSWKVITAGKALGRLTALIFDRLLDSLQRRRQSGIDAGSSPLHETSIIYEAFKSLKCGRGAAGRHFRAQSAVAQDTRQVGETVAVLAAAGVVDGHRLGRLAQHPSLTDRGVKESQHLKRLLGGP